MDLIEHRDLAQFDLSVEWLIVDEVKVVRERPGVEDVAVVFMCVEHLVRVGEDELRVGGRRKERGWKKIDEKRRG